MLNTDTLSARSKRIYWPILALILGLCGFGVMMMVSAGAGDWSEYALSQLLRVGLGLGLMVAVMLCPPSWLYRLAYVGFALAFLMLIAVEVMGHTGMGAQRWLKLGALTVQPSEFMKLVLIVTLARFYHNTHPDQISQPKHVAIALLLILLPVALILKQPNLGTATITTLIGITILFMAGLSIWYFLIGGVLMGVSAPIAWQFLHPYQKERVMTFLNPQNDPLGAGYNIIQSQIAIGSGGMWGKGFLEGTQAQLNFLPEKHTDFIFTMLAEEWGFVGSIVMLCCFLALFIYGIKVIIDSRSMFGRLVASGVIAFIFSHVFINISMVMGLLPVVGLPLPFLSYGGSITLSTLLAMGLLLNMGINRDQPLLFKM